jgi:putative transposase
MTEEPAWYSRHRFPAEIIGHAVWLCRVFSLSLHDVELILAERGVVVTHESIRHWCRRFGADFAGDCAGADYCFWGQLASPSAVQEY